jgi:hypothetical protein
MDQKVERVLSEIERRVERLRAGLADLSAALERESWARACDDAERVRDLEACRDRIAELERRTLANTGASAGVSAGAKAGVNPGANVGPNARALTGTVSALRRKASSSAHR